MSKSHTFIIRLRDDNQGQDLIEYALMAGFVAVAAGALLPNVSSQIGLIFTAVNDRLNLAATAAS